MTTLYPIYLYKRWLNIRFLLYQLLDALNSVSPNQNCLPLQVFVFVVLFIYCLITSPLLIIVIAASCVTCFILSAKQVCLNHVTERNWIFYNFPTLSLVALGVGDIDNVIFSFQQNRKLMIANHEVTLVQQYAVVALFSIPIFLIAGAGTYSYCSVLTHESCSAMGLQSWEHFCRTLLMEQNAIFTRWIPLSTYVKD